MLKGRGQLAEARSEEAKLGKSDSRGEGPTHEEDNVWCNGEGISFQASSLLPHRLCSMNTTFPETPESLSGSLPGSLHLHRSSAAAYALGRLRKQSTETSWAGSCPESHRGKISV